MQRFKLTIEYDGRPFAGWQRQKDILTVQEVLENALSAFLPSENAVVSGSGRTDAGVHAIGQVAHVDVMRDIGPDELQGALNYHCRPHPVSVLAVEPVDSEFHARFSAVRRHYTYKICNRRAPLTFHSGLEWHVKAPLDVEKMDKAAQYLVGQHDFTSFRHIHCQAQSPIKTVDYVKVERTGDVVLIHAGARSFLHHQIRSFTGTLQQVGIGKLQPNAVKDVLEACDRSALPLNAPPDGLYFRSVEY
ncbi:tRNA pseudouridine(38-40) synthase TruA [Kordiimonas sp. SCSIO 12610]|uniref:tRNA pseudouridine(38-40) synthase TruA n=1 Tax=Kordiimonas sp. SCSIO 12610 TaxID=2829597 RepID=UPI00210B3915|nr:tRNA pseudouridine(38-40) synthase TruA [Kordiimonas sp. SCSIO 12610]UTW55528.1 tRNA pseudouridine(38-40) synthase TruA [Kordiimonas sp. SCSIO 12610]